MSIRNGMRFCVTRSSPISIGLLTTCIFHLFPFRPVLVLGTSRCLWFTGARGGRIRRATRVTEGCLIVIGGGIKMIGGTGKVVHRQ